MHKLAEKIADCMKAKVEGMGIDNINGQNLVEFELWSKIIKNLVCYDKDKKIIEAMDEAEEADEAMKYIEMYEDYPERKGYRGQPRDSRGRYMSRRGYESRMMPEMDYDEMERMRDYDRESGKMYYSGSGSSGGSSSGMSSGGSSSGMSSGSMGSNSGSRGYSEGGRDSREGRSGQSRRGYMEAKEQGKDKQAKMRELEEYMKELSSDVTEMIGDASPEEKSMLKNKMQVLMQKIG